jgi:outer membrane protein
MVYVQWVRGSRRAIGTMAVATVASVGVPVFAQQPAAPPAQQAAQQLAPSGPVLQLTMEQAATMAVEHNLGVKAERLNLDVAAQDVAISKAGFLPVVTFGINRNNRSQPPQSFADGTESITSSNNLSGTGTVTQAVRWYGGQYQVRWDGNRLYTPGGGASFNPSLGSTLSIGFSQPLWRDRTIDPLRGSVEASERRRVVADVALEQQLIATDVAARLMYLQLVAAIEGLKVARQNLEIRQESLNQARARVAVGASAQIEVIQAEAEVANNREQVIVADAAISSAEDNLRTLIMDPARPDYWTVRLEPTDQITPTPRQIDVDAAIKNALSNRLDLVIARRNIEITDLNLKVGHNNTMPAVDFNVNYTAVGTGGVQRSLDGVIERGFGTVLGQAFTGDFPTWNVGVSVAYPIGRTAAIAQYAQGQVQKRRQELTLRDAELEVVRQVREAARQVQNSLERIQATQAALTATEQQLEAEKRRFAVGLSTTLDMQIRQSQLAQARVNELNARISYNRALINFDRVQKTQ